MDCLSGRRSGPQDGRNSGKTDQGLRKIRIQVIVGGSNRSDVSLYLSAPQEAGAAHHYHASMYHVQAPEAYEAIELKGGALTVVVLHLRQSDPRVLYPQLESVIEKAGAFLASAPVVIDVTALDEDAQRVLDFSYLLRFLRGENLVPVGVQGVSEVQKDRVSQAGLLHVTTAKRSAGPAAVEHGRSTVQERTATPAPRPEPMPEPAPRKAAQAAAPPPAQEAIPALTTTTLVTKPVRSGQQISAPHGDLIVLAPVNAGSELFAAGNIHVYGALRGRALAGVNGDTEARIFTLQGNPELLAIAGEYVVNDELPRSVMHRSFAVSWTNSGLRFQVLGSLVP